MTEQTERIPRAATARDVPQLKALWKTVFGDGDADIDRFFSAWFSPDLTIVIDDGTKPAAAAYILPVGSLVLPDGVRFDCAMLYAIATLPDCRGLGYGEAVTRAAWRLAAQKGYPAIVLKPASDGLFEFYEKHSDFLPYFDVYEAEFPPGDLTRPDTGYALSPVSPAEYRALRQSFLRGAAYIDMDEHGLSYQLYLSEKSGGGLYQLVQNGACAGCAVIEPEDGTVHIKELLLLEGCRMPDAVSAIAARWPGEKYKVRTLPRAGNSQTRFGMLAPIEGHPDISYVYSAKWYGLAFD